MSISTDQFRHDGPTSIGLPGIQGAKGNRARIFFYGNIDNKVSPPHEFDPLPIVFTGIDGKEAMSMIVPHVIPGTGTKVYDQPEPYDYILYTGIGVNYLYLITDISVMEVDGSEQPLRYSATVKCIDQIDTSDLTDDGDAYDVSFAINAQGRPVTRTVRLPFDADITVQEIVLKGGTTTDITQHNPLDNTPDITDEINDLLNKNKNQDNKISIKDAFNDYINKGSDPWKNSDTSTKIVFDPNNLTINDNNPTKYTPIESTDPEADTTNTTKRFLVHPVTKQITTTDELYDLSVVITSPSMFTKNMKVVIEFYTLQSFVMDSMINDKFDDLSDGEHVVIPWELNSYYGNLNKYSPIQPDPDQIYTLTSKTKFIYKPVNFDDERLENFSYTIKDFGEGNDTRQFGASIPILAAPLRRAKANPHAYVYVYIKDGIFMDKIFLGEFSLDFLFDKTSSNTFNT